ncbi:MAG: dihydrodipicolinate synthase family protein [Gammaproteobacteria bacterium]|uniref:Dihydrodipicolinate synthase family protein n=1 Tax=Vreelandella titanicae TaxID=664683 RepID=A0A558J7U4_9GAMM|nr:dihydrodipicolinate synthase family protein [Halomonas titanicae]MBR9903420.1 dihydrodipicolinate synthase family protein [Gammaproteobacteria bacterium]TVU89716.1 dihydrodipicolinate synthase family protein [Halomonas titanicae]
MFTGLSAFPLTPMNEQSINEHEFVRLVEYLAEAGVDSIGVLGSTGSYAYLNREERARVVQLSVESAGGMPIVVGIGALRTRDVLANVENAQQAGASGVLLAPVSYQKLTDDEVFDLYATVCQSLSVPLCVYDNPGTTHFEFSDELHGRIAQLPQVRSIKIPPVNNDIVAATERVTRLRKLIPSDVTIGISGDAAAATGLNAGCDAWYSVIGGIYPKAALALTRAAQAGEAQQAKALSDALEPLWALYREYGGSLRVAATIAEVTGKVSHPCLPQPLKTLQGDNRKKVERVLEQLGLESESSN